MLSSDPVLTLIGVNCIAPSINKVIKISPEIQVISGEL